jgi:hypothetical protein
MNLNGRKLVRNRNYGWRWANPVIDVDRNGNLVPANYRSFVKIKDCPTYRKNGKLYYDAEGVQCIPVNHGGTYYGYGEWKKRKCSEGKWVENEKGEMERVFAYWHATVYMADGIYVYTTSLRRTKKPTPRFNKNENTKQKIL